MRWGSDIVTLARNYLQNLTIWNILKYEYKYWRFSIGNGGGDLHDLHMADIGLA